ncbi:MAG: hypothetical protein HFJ86_12070 [Oscillospiraceae bacterium]|jgi:hypothetical protein|nr:hypothetical protein [Oscillospiraceae bacterium]
MKLYEVIDTIQMWIRTVQEMYHGEIDVEFLVEHEDYLRYIIESANYLAELVVEPEGFHPHRYVSFVALDKRKDLLQEPYFYYDEKDSSVENILENLNKGISHVVE